MTITTFNTATILALVIQVLLPLLVGLLTKVSTHPGLKAVALLVLTFVNTYVVEWSNAINAHQVFNWKGYLITTAINFVIAVAVHYGVWKPTGVTNVMQNSLVKDSNPPAQKAA